MRTERISRSSRWWSSPFEGQKFSSRIPEVDDVPVDGVLPPYGGYAVRPNFQIGSRVFRHHAKSPTRGTVREVDGSMILVDWDTGFMDGARQKWYSKSNLSLLPGTYVSGGVARVRYGRMNDTGNHLPGTTIAHFRDTHEAYHMWSLPRNAKAYKGTEELPEDYVIKAGESIEFHRVFADRDDDGYEFDLREAVRYLGRPAEIRGRSSRWKAAMEDRERWYSIEFTDARGGKADQLPAYVLGRNPDKA